jgi:hypothetical protein
VGVGFWFCTQDFPGKPYGLYHASGLAIEHRKPIHRTMQNRCIERIQAAIAVTLSELPTATPDDNESQATGNQEVALIDAATYLQDSDAIKDHTVLPAGFPFGQSWAMQNSGTTTWGVGYALAWIGDDRIGAPTKVQIPACAPGQTVRIVVPFAAPQQPGAYKSTWQLCNPAGKHFGDRIWTEINIAALPGFSPAPAAMGRGAAFEREMADGMEGDTDGAAARQGVARSPMPQSPIAGKSLAEADPELYAAWRAHMLRGFENNQRMFEQVLTGFMNPYWTTVWMYRILFGLGLAAFVVAAIVAFVTHAPVLTGIFGGLSVAAFLSYFLSRPLQALEENLQFITWLGIVYNSYWTRLVYTSDLATVQQELEDATNNTVAKLSELSDKYGERNASRPMFGRPVFRR